MYLVRSFVLPLNHRVMNKPLILREEIKDLPDTPCHPVSSRFPSRTFESARKVNRSFQSSWCHRFSWIHYDNVTMSQERLNSLRTLHIHKEN